MDLEMIQLDECETQRGPFRVSAAAFSLIGERMENQDAFSIRELASNGLAGVADGVGGRPNGKEAARAAIRSLEASGALTCIADCVALMKRADTAVQQSTVSTIERAGTKPGAAMAFIGIAHDHAADWMILGANVGDVRIYSKFSDSPVRLESLDHTPAYAQWEAGELSFDEIPSARDANRLQRFLGGSFAPHVFAAPAFASLWIVVASDGVFKCTTRRELGDVLVESAKCARDLLVGVLTARRLRDNTTAIIVRLEQGANQP